MNLKIALSCVAAAMMVALASASETLYVACDDPNASDEAVEGRGTEALPYATIQAAVAAAQEDWTVLVKPGVYTNGEMEVEGYGSSRLVIDRRLTICSTGGKDVTVIEGRLGTSSGSWGLGSLRAILVKPEGGGSIVRGFTIRNAATLNENGDRGCGAGFYALANAFIADCVVTNCHGRNTGGALHGGTAIRCLFADNKHGDYNWNGGILHRANLWYCVVDHYTENGFGSYNACTNVGCSYFNSGSPCDRGSVYYNCLKNKDTTGNNNTVVSATAFFSPNDYDYETVAGVANYKVGVTANIYTVFDIPESLRGTDFAGNAIDVSGETCTVGAFDVPVVAEHGSINLNGTVTVVGGRTGISGSYIRSRTYPRVYTIVKDDIAALSSGSPLAVPQMDGKTYYYALPFSPDKTLGTWSGPGKVLHVSQERGSDNTGDGTADNPYATIQRACDDVAKSSYPLIKVSAGTYAPFSLALDTGYFGRVFATEGPEKTFLVGGDEVRCATFSGATSLVLQGFTLTGANWTTTAANALVSGQVTLADCLVSNNVSAAGSLMNSGYAIRTRFIGNTTGNAIYEGSGGMGFCLFAGNSCGGSVVSGAGNPRIFNCSFYGNTTGANAPLIGVNNVYPNNCLFDANGGAFSRHADTGIAPSYVDNYTIGPNSSVNAKIIDRAPMFVDPSSGDFRVPSNWMAATEGLFGSADVHMADYQNYVQGDLYGEAPVFTKDGKTPLGCVQGNLVPAVVIVDTAGGLAIEGCHPGVNQVEPGTPLTVSVSARAEGRRRAIGVIITELDGTVITNLFAESPVWTRTISDASGAFALEALYSPDWYVDAVNGNDANDGFTPETAKKTLADVVTNTAVRAGDVIHALPGTYEIGFMISEVDTVTRSRVVVPVGVSLVSTDGKDATVIKGAIAEDAGRAADGCGIGATRCVRLESGARIEGFTFRGGRTTAVWTSQDAENYYGAAVSAADKTATVVDCHLVDCVGGAAVHRGICIRCRADTCGRISASVFDESVLMSCIVNRSSEGSPARDCTIYNSILRPSNAYFAVTHDNGMAKTVKAYNSVFYGPLTSANATYENCVCITNADVHNLWGDCMRPGAAGTETLLFTNSADIALTDYRPMTADHPFVDAGDNALLPSGDDASLDIAGAPRAMNRRVDLGAYEWDIRPDLAADLGRKATVDFVTANVVENGGTVLLDGDGARLEATLAARAGQSRGQAVTVTGTGVLKVYLNGTLVAEKGAGTWDLDFGKLAASNALVYVVEGDATAEFAGTKSREGLLLFFR